MIFNAITAIPFTLLIILSMALFMLITYLAAYYSDYFFLHKKENQYSALANSFMSILTGGFFVLLAFIIINTWSYQQEAKAAASTEAVHLAKIINNSAILPPEVYKKIRDAVADYTVAVRVDEWSTMQNGKDSPLAWENLYKLNKVIQDYKPQSHKERLFYSLIVSDRDGVLSSRWERLNKIDSLIPTSLSYPIFIGSILIAFLLGIIRGKDNFINLTPILLFSGLFGFNLAIAISFDSPFSGDISISKKFFYNGILNSFSDSIIYQPKALPSSPN